MAVSAEQVARLRRMVAEPAEDTYTDETLTALIEGYPLRDGRGKEPYTWDASTTPPTQEANESWVPTYDLHAAAEAIWQEKAAAVAANYQFSADGASYQRQQAHEHALQQARYHAARKRVAVAHVRIYPPVLDEDMMWIGNLAEEE